MIAKSNRKYPNVVVLGGGTGTYVVLSGLKQYPLNLFAVVTMMDSGGSTGRLRDQLGVLPPGDVRQALVALSDSQKIWRDLFTYRFTDGDLKGHSFGNIFLSSLEKITGSLETSLKLAAKILDVQGSVVPVTFTKTDLCVEYSDGSCVEGETKIEDSTASRQITRAYLKDEAKANPQALEVIQQADFIIFGPGDLYTSIIPNLLVTQIPEAINKSKAKKIFVMNLMSKVGQTSGFSASDHVTELQRYLKFGTLDYVLINTKRPSTKILNRYLHDKEKMIADDLEHLEIVHDKPQIVREDLLYVHSIESKAGDSVKRSFIRHDPKKLAQVLFDLIS